MVHQCSCHEIQFIVSVFVETASKYYNLSECIVRPQELHLPPYLHRQVRTSPRSASTSTRLTRARCKKQLLLRLFKPYLYQHSRPPKPEPPLSRRCEQVNLQAAAPVQLSSNRKSSPQSDAHQQRRWQISLSSGAKTSSLQRTRL